MSTIQMKIPSPGESITEVTISKWLVADGDVVEKDQELCEIESDKATLTINAEEAGQIKIIAKEGVAKVGDVVCEIDTDVKIPDSKIQKFKNSNITEKIPNTEHRTPNIEVKREKPETNYATGTPSPSAKKIMEEKNISAEKIKGTGKNGRITKADVIAGGDGEEKQEQNQKTETVSNVPEKKIANGNRNERREKMSPLRKKLAQRLVAVKQETAMLTTFNEVDMSEINHLRVKYKDAFKEKFGVSIGFMSFFTKAVCESLAKFPAVNASIDGDEFVFHDYCDIGIAVSAPKGLVVPVVRNAEKLSLAEIEKEIKRLAIAARDNKITISDMSGGTFTITNGGVFGSLMSTPILNPPQAAILGMHNVVDRPIAVNGKVEIRPMMYVALSYDHRIIDGKESVSFLVSVKQLLENPLKLLFDGKDPEEVVMGL